jgi:hypothetical protein
VLLDQPLHVWGNMPLAGNDGEVGRFSRNLSYSSGVISIRSVHLSSAPSHTQSDNPSRRSRDSLISLTRSLTSRNNDWFLPAPL